MEGSPKLWGRLVVFVFSIHGSASWHCERHEEEIPELKRNFHGTTKIEVFQISCPKTAFTSWVCVYFQVPSKTCHFFSTEQLSSLSSSSHRASTAVDPTQSQASVRKRCLGSCMCFARFLFLRVILLLFPVSQSPELGISRGKMVDFSPPACFDSSCQVHTAVGIVRLMSRWASNSRPARAAVVRFGSRWEETGGDGGVVGLDGLMRGDDEVFLPKKLR